MAEWNIEHIAETDSTNRWLRDWAAAQTGPLTELVEKVVVADYQTAGRGCATNSWESERGKNLLFSILIHPKMPSDEPASSSLVHPKTPSDEPASSSLIHPKTPSEEPASSSLVHPRVLSDEGTSVEALLPAKRQFHISMAISLAVCEALGQYIGDLSIKWPNDIYWRDGKIAGILIEQTLKGGYIKDSIIGVGLNVNQRVFHSDAPNPVSMWQITEQETDREQLLKEILRAFQYYLGAEMKEQYLSMLYRRKGFYPYADHGGAFMAELLTVDDDGHLLLRDDNGNQRRYAFKEVTFI